MKKAQQTKNKGNVFWFKYKMSSLGLCQSLVGGAFFRRWQKF